MNPLKVSAQFAAYVWFTQWKEETTREPARFAKDNWIAFLPYADKNIGMLLIEIAKPRPKAVRRPLWSSSRRRKRVCNSNLAVAT